MSRINPDWLVYMRHPKFPHGQVALIRSANGNMRKIGAVFNERLNPERPKGCPPPPSSALFTVEFYFPQVLGRGADNIVKYGAEQQAKAELERRFVSFIEDIVFHRCEQG